MMIRTIWFGVLSAVVITVSLALSALCLQIGASTAAIGFACPAALQVCAVALYAWGNRRESDANTDEGPAGARVGHGLAVRQT